MSNIKFGCQLYTWQMSKEKYSGKLEHITEIVKQAGFQGIELETCMLGDYFDDANKFAVLLESKNLELAAVCLVCDWNQSSETESEIALADKTIEFTRKFNGAIINLCQMPGNARDNLESRQQNAIKCINAVAKRAAEKGVMCTFHPNSPEGSIFRTRQDYKILLSGLDSEVLSFCPDSGHMLKGGIDIMECLEQCKSTIMHFHFKDIDGEGIWRGMGKGITNFSQIIDLLSTIDYKGWVMVEEESKEAVIDPDGVAFENGKYIFEIYSKVMKL